MQRLTASAFQFQDDPLIFMKAASCVSVVAVAVAVFGNFLQ